MKSIIENELTIDNLKIRFALFKLHNSFLLLISDQDDMGIGTVTLASPPLFEGLKSTAASYALFGIENKLLSTIISERASHILNKPVLLLLFLKTKKKEEELAKPIANLLDQILKKLNEKDKDNIM
jgi:hypothetical protein